MKARLIAQIGAENNKVQSIQPTDEPALIEGGYERLQKLVWDLKQLDHNSRVVSRVWIRLVDIGNFELRKVRGNDQRTPGSPKTQAYVDAHRQVKEQINQTISSLFQ